MSDKRKGNRFRVSPKRAFVGVLAGQVIVFALLMLPVVCGGAPVGDTLEEAVVLAIYGVAFLLLFCTAGCVCVVLKAVVSRIAQRRFQFSLRTLLLLITVAGPVIGIFGPKALLMLRRTSWDWGIFKPHGGLILFVSSIVYLTCFQLSCILLWQIGRKLYRPKTALVLAMVTLIPMGLAAFNSMTWQMTSAHYQQDTHIRATCIIGGCFVLVLAMRLVAGLLTPNAR